MSTKPKSSSAIKKHIAPTATAASAAVTSSDTPSHHPRYIDMICEAIKSLKERTGSSRQSIMKYIMGKYHLDEKSASRSLNQALKSGVSKSILKQMKGVGANG